LAPRLYPAVETELADFLIQAETYACSNASLTEFGFIEGCLLEAFQPESYFGALGPDFIRHRLGYYLGQPEKPFYGLEGILPFAAMVRFLPGDEELDSMLQLVNSHFRKHGFAMEGDRIVAETNYTLSYPLAVMARERNDPDLARMALTQIDATRARLRQPEAIALRAWTNGERAFVNWARGIAWYFYGLSRTLRTLNGFVDIPQDCVRDLLEAAEWILTLQRPDGLWGSFVDDPDTLPDTSGSAGIAAALAEVGQAHAKPAFIEAARKAAFGMKPYFSPDGLIGGSTQHNCGGEPLQRGNYRVYQTYTLGLFLQLIGHLGYRSQLKLRPRPLHEASSAAPLPGRKSEVHSLS
jgi:hypothetical protein